MLKITPYVLWSPFDTWAMKIILWQIALKEHDEKEFYLARQHIFDLRNLYAIITDLIHKNISKVSDKIGCQLQCAQNTFP
jgi:hypothetical protein